MKLVERHALIVTDRNDQQFATQQQGAQGVNAAAQLFRRLGLGQE